ncbi:Crossover junction endonuclease mus81 [Chytriomyces hyalinus]|nr:Crossover junction endonuclease mus81 [Chytriomyces hyalinus]
MDLKALFLQWLSDMHEEEKKKAVSRGNSRLFSVYKKASFEFGIRSKDPDMAAHDELAKYPLPVATPRDVLIVKNIGPGILKELETRLAAHLGTNPSQIELQPTSAHSFLHEPLRAAPKKKNSAIAEADTADTAPQPAPKRVRKVEYVPKYRSGAWAILVALKQGGQGYMSKHDIVQSGQEHADMPLDTPGAGTMYSGWAAMKGLKEKELVMAYGNPPRFCLTEEGETLVDRMLASMDQTTSVANANPSSVIDGRNSSSHPQATQYSSNNGIFKSVSTLSEDSSEPASQLSHASSKRQRFAPDTASNQPFRSLSFAPGEFEIVLLLDTREVKNGANRSFFYDGLVNRNVKVEQRMLELGDVMFIARPKMNGQQYHGDDELVLEYIIERKTMDDLVSSIKDGRFKEQKFRLSECGAPNVIYVIEEVSTESAEFFGMDAVQTAITQTQFENGFFVKKTTSAEDTLNYLVSLMNALKTVYQNKTLALKNGNAPVTHPNPNTVYSLTFQEFSRQNTKTKNFCLGDVWIRQLMTVPGMSLEKAVFFSRTFKTGAGLFKSLTSCSSDAEREKVIQGAGGESRKAIGNALAKKILSLFWRSEVSTAEF